jgi:hypothetical protein
MRMQLQVGEIAWRSIRIDTDGVYTSLYHDAEREVTV